MCTKATFTRKESAFSDIQITEFHLLMDAMKIEEKCKKNFFPLNKSREQTHTFEFKNTFLKQVEKKRKKHQKAK